MQDKAQLHQMLAEHGLSRIADAVEQLALPSIRLVLTRCGGRRIGLSDLPDESPVGISKVGGDPDLPPDFEWPLWEGIPLSFVAQFNLADVAPFDGEELLPSSGMLYFFYDVTMEVFMSGGDAVNWKVSHYDGDLSVLSRTPAPPDLPEFGGVEPCLISFHREWSVPALDGVEMLDVMENSAFTGEEYDRYQKFRQQFDRTNVLNISREEKPLPADYRTTHRLLGCADVLYNDGRVEAVSNAEDEYIEPEQWEQFDEETRRQMRFRVSQKARDWRLLFQIDSDSSIGMNWGDAGLMFFFIHKDNLQGRNFDDVELTYEGC